MNYILNNDNKGKDNVNNGKENYTFSQFNEYMFDEHFINNAIKRDAIKPPIKNFKEDHINTQKINNKLNTIVSIDTNTNTNTNKEFTPFQLDKLFWCFYLILEGYENYELHKNNSYIFEKKFKIDTIEKIQNNNNIKDKLKQFKVKLNEIEDEFVYQSHITVKGLLALCLYYNVSIMYIINRTYYDFNHIINENGKKGVIIKQTSNNQKDISISYTIDYHDQLIRETFLHIDNIQKSLKSISSYTLNDLQNICKKLLIEIFDIHGKKKSKNVLYQDIITKI